MASGKEARIARQSIANVLFICGFGLLWCAGFFEMGGAVESGMVMSSSMRLVKGASLIALGMLALRCRHLTSLRTGFYGAVVLVSLTGAFSPTGLAAPFWEEMFGRLAYAFSFFCWVAMSLRLSLPCGDASIAFALCLGSGIALLGQSGICPGLNYMSCTMMSLACMAGCYIWCEFGDLDDGAANRGGAKASSRAIRLMPLILGVFALSFAFGLTTDLQGWMAEPGKLESIQIINAVSAGMAGIVFLFYRKPFRLDAALATVLPVFAVALLFVPLGSEGVSLPRVVIMAGHLLYWVIAWTCIARDWCLPRSAKLAAIAFVSGIMMMLSQVGRMVAERIIEAGLVDVGALAFASTALFWLLVLLSIGTYWISKSRAVERDLALLAVAIEQNVAIDAKDERSGPTGCDVADARGSRHRGSVFDAKAMALGDRIGLSARELEVMCEFVHGRSASIIAERLYISRNTVKTHLRRIYEKAGVHSRQELLDILEAESLHDAD